MMADLAGSLELFCANHDGELAVGACEVCAKPICTRCLRRIGAHVLCEEPAHMEIVEEWVILMRSSSEFEVDLFVRNLEIGAIRTSVFSSRKHKMTIGENRTDHVDLYVPLADKERAVQFLQSLGLFDEATEQSIDFRKEQSQ